MKFARKPPAKVPMCPPSQGSNVDPVFVRRALDPHGSGRREVRVLAANDATIGVAVDHDRADVHIRARHVLGKGLALELHDLGVQRLLEGGEAPAFFLDTHSPIFEEAADARQGLLGAGARAGSNGLG
jgi:hypothetical protein